MNLDRVKTKLADLGPNEVVFLSGLTRYMKEEDLSLDELVLGAQEFLAERRKVIQELELDKATEPIFTCTACGKPAYLDPVTTPEGKANLFGWKSVYRCYSCGKELYSINNIASEINARLKEKTNGNSK